MRHSAQAAITARARKDTLTKRLVQRLRPGEIAVIDHQDLDAVAAEALASAGVAAVLNAAPSITGRYPNGGPRVLLRHGIPLVDLPSRDVFAAIRDGDQLCVAEGRVLRDGTLLAEGQTWTAASLDEALAAARQRITAELLAFARNTLEYLRAEPELAVEPPLLPELATALRGRHVVVVGRGPSSSDDLRAIRAYIADMQPVLMAVDGGANLLLRHGLKPALIVGDLDSASEGALRCGAEIVVHTYPDGSGPGIERARQLGLDIKRISVRGTSEDAALTLAYHKGADLIVQVGSHTSLLDFLDKGRAGMSSTFLVRLRVADRLVDAKGVSKLYPSGATLRQVGYVALAAALTGGACILISPFVRGFLRVVGIRLALVVSDLIAHIRHILG